METLHMNNMSLCWLKRRMGHVYVEGKYERIKQIYTIYVYIRTTIV